MIITGALTRHAFTYIN